MAILEKLAEGFLVVEKHGKEWKKQFRLARCSGCSYNRKGTCALCKCIIKVKIESETNRTMKNGFPIGPIEKTHCPIGNWLDKDVANFYRAKRNKILIK